MRDAVGGHLNAMHFLVEHGAAVDGINSDGWTPFMWVAEGSNLNVVRFLVELTVSAVPPAIGPLELDTETRE